MSDPYDPPLREDAVDPDDYPFPYATVPWVDDPGDGDAADWGDPWIGFEADHGRDGDDADR